jgi:hypothetical protein
MADDLSRSTEALSLQPRTLVNLPSEVQERIYDFLLDARSLKNTPLCSHQAFPRYGFSTAILRVCKSITNIALRASHGNHFILVSTADSRASGMLEDHRVWYRSDRISYFQHFVLRLHLQSTLSSTKTVKFFLVCLDSVETFVNVLRLTNIEQQRSWRLKFEFKASRGEALPLLMQRRLLQPFFKLRGKQQVCTIQGAVEPDLAQSGTERMMPRFHWIRERSWELLDLLVFKLEIANNLAISGDMRAASDAYGDLINLVPKTKAEAYCAQSDDKVLARKFHRLCCLVLINRSQVLVLESRELEDAPRKQNYIQVIRAVPNWDISELGFFCTPLEVASWYICEAICRLALGDMTQAADMFAMACVTKDKSLDKKDEATRKYADICAQGVRATLVAEQAKIGRPFPFTCQATISVEDVHWSNMIECERYIVTKLGYTGDLLEDKVKSLPGWAFDPFLLRAYQGAMDFDVADRFVTIVRETLAMERLERHPGAEPEWGFGTRLVERRDEPV